MDSYDFAIGQNDDQVLWSFPVFDATGAQVDMTGGSVSIRFRIDDLSAPEQTLAGQVVAQQAGAAWAGHLFVASELTSPGVYIAQAICTTAAGVRFTHPQTRKMRVLVQAQA